MGLLIAIVALLAGTGVVLHERAKEGATLPLFLPSTFGGLVRDQVYRVWIKNSDLDLGETDLRQALLDRGFSEVFLAIEDPTDPRVWSLLARWDRDVPSGVNFPPVTIYRVEPIESLPADVAYPPIQGLDADLTDAEAHAVHVAIRREQDPDQLEGFSKIMIDDFPLAGVMLQARADALRARTQGASA